MYRSLRISEEEQMASETLKMVFSCSSTVIPSCSTAAWLCARASSCRLLESRLCCRPVKARGISMTIR